MINKKNRTLIKVAIVILSFAAISYFSCTKVGKAPICNGVKCFNGAFCNDSFANAQYLAQSKDKDTLNPSYVYRDSPNGKCMCPVGYEGKYCEKAKISKYFGTWYVKQVYIGSDSATYVGKDSLYSIVIDTTNTPTTFYIQNFMGNLNYNKIICTMDSANSYTFVIDTMSSVQMWFAPSDFHGGKGYIAPDGSTIFATFSIKMTDATHNWKQDTFNVYMQKMPF